MGVLVALVVIAAVAVLVARLKPGSSEDEPWYGGHEGPEPLPPLGVTTVPVEGWTVVRSSLRPSEAAVAQALLESNGIRAVLESAVPTSHYTAAYPAGNWHYRLAVPDDQAEAADALLPDPS